MGNTEVFKSQTGKTAIMDYYDSLLKKLKVPYEEINVDTRFGNTHVLAGGKEGNPVIVLLHGSSMNSTMWIGDISVLAKNYKVYAPDMPGEPGKSVELQLPFDTSDYSDWLLDVFNTLSIENAILIGASLGGWLAAKFASSHTDRVAKLVLECPGGIGSQNHGFKDIAFSLLMKGEDGLNELFRKINGDNPIPDEILNYQKLVALFFNARQEVIPIFPDNDLEKLTMPSILFVGEKDIMLNSGETIERVSKLMPHAEIVNLPDKGHSLAGLVYDIVDFLEK